MSKKEYVKKITNLLKLCEDVSLLDLIFLILNKSINKNKEGENLHE
jgi:hypothetical protein